MTHREWSPKPFFRHLTPAALADLRSWAAADLRADGSGKPWEQMYRIRSATTVPQVELNGVFDRGRYGDR